jgi:hypothetical protein
MRTAAVVVVAAARRTCGGFAPVGFGKLEQLVERPECCKWRDAKLRGVLEGPSVGDVDDKVRVRDEVFGKRAVRADPCGWKM